MSDSDSINEVSDDSSPWDDTRVTAYVMGELTEDESAAFEAALERDESLASAVQQVRALTDELAVLFADEPGVALDEDRRQEILAAGVDSDSRHLSTVPQRPAFPTGIAAVVLAAAATILLAILFPNIGAVRESFKTAKQVEHSPSHTRSVEQKPLENSIDEKTGNEAVIAQSQANLQSHLELPSQAELPTTSQPVPTSGKLRMSKMANGRNIRYEFKEGEKLPTIVQPASVEASAASAPAVPESVVEFYEQAAKQRDTALSQEILIKGKMRQLESIQRAKAEKVSSTALAPAPKFAVSAGDKVVENVYGRNLSLAKSAAPSVRVSPDGSIRAPAEQSDHLQFWIDRPMPDRDRFDTVTENEFKRVSDEDISTFSIDVDTASYSKVRRTLNSGRLPRPDAVRIEELVNYFQYDYDAPDAESEHPFSANVTIAGCPWNETHQLARVALQGKSIQRGERPPCNLVFLLDTSGSMNRPNKLPLVIEGMKLLTKQLNKEDRVAIVVYAGSAGLVLESTPADNKRRIKKALTKLSAGGSTNGGAGIQLAYATARDNFIAEGVNRVILCTDGDFNVGLSGTDQLVRLIKEEASSGIFLTALGFGMGNHNDAMLEQISGKGNGNYAFIDTVNEAKKVLVRQTEGTLITIAKDVKVQIVFNPRLISQYRLIGYENRMLAKEDFNDDKKDAGEIGAGHQVTALYELIPADTEQPDEKPAVDASKYLTERSLTDAAASDEVMTVRLRYKQPDASESTRVEFVAKDDEQDFNDVDTDLRFAAAVASFGMQLRQSQFSGSWKLDNVLAVAEQNRGSDEYKLRSEFVELVRTAIRLTGEQ